MRGRKIPHTHFTKIFFLGGSARSGGLGGGAASQSSPPAALRPRTRKSVTTLPQLARDRAAISSFSNKRALRADQIAFKTMPLRSVHMPRNHSLTHAGSGGAPSGSKGQGHASRRRHIYTGDVTNEAGGPRAVTLHPELN